MIDKHAYHLLKRSSPLGRVALIGKPDSSCHIRNPMAAIASMADRVTIVDKLPTADFVHDLNRPLPCGNVYGQFDTVYDCGTIEHIANIGQCLQSYHELLAEGGRLIINTMSDGFQAHGFWQINPQLFYSLFSGINGYGDTQVWTYRGIFSNQAWLWLEPRQARQEFRIQLPRILLMTTTKVSHVPLNWPSQSYWTADSIPPTGWRNWARMAGDIVKSSIRSIF